MGEPEFEMQMNEFDKPEKIDISEYTIKIMCAEPDCLRIRYIKPQDAKQVKLCKLHARLLKLRSRAQHTREKRRAKSK